MALNLLTMVLLYTTCLAVCNKPIQTVKMVRQGRSRTINIRTVAVYVIAIINVSRLRIGPFASSAKAQINSVDPTSLRVAESICALMAPTGDLKYYLRWMGI